MSARSQARRRERREDNEQDFELNIASIIDCFTVLITYLLVSASFISIGVFDVSGTGAGVADASVVPTTLKVQLESGHRIGLELTGPGERKAFEIAARDGGWDFDTLSDKIKHLRESTPELNQSSVAAGDQIEYRDLVKTIEVVRQDIPSVAIGEAIVEGQ